MELVYQYDLVQISYSLSQKMLFVSWQNYLTTEDFMRGLRALLQLTKELEIQNWIIDCSLSEELEIKNFHWSKSYIGSVLENTQLKKVAIIIPANHVNKPRILNLVDYLISQHTGNCTFNFFENDFTALNWVSQTLEDKNKNQPEIFS